MSQNEIAKLPELERSFVTCQNSQGSEVHGSLVRFTRHLAVFEVYNPTVVLRASESLTEFKLQLDHKVVYSGKAVVSNLVNTGPALICEATLDDFWLDLDVFSLESQQKSLGDEFRNFLEKWEKLYRIQPSYKILLADMQSFLMDLRLWLEQVELRVRSEPAGDRAQHEREILTVLQTPVFRVLKELFERFEDASRAVEPELQPAHRYYVKRQLHPIVLCSPFMYRTFQKPLGYAGDYEMVNMMVRDPYEGGSLFAKILNGFFLSTPPVVAHRNRITRLKEVLVRESCRVAAANRRIKVFNMGCGPAQEIQDFLSEGPIADQADFTLVDFNEETVGHVQRTLSDFNLRHGRTTTFQLQRKSVVQFLKEAAKPLSSLTTTGFDLVYCAGLFDYLTDNVCQKLMSAFYEMAAPGGLILISNVDPTNPSRNWMEFSVDWHLIYRGQREMKALCPTHVPVDNRSVRAEPSGTNIFLEVRKSSHG